MNPATASRCADIDRFHVDMNRNSIACCLPVAHADLMLRISGYADHPYAVMFALAAILVRWGTAKTLVADSVGRVGALDGLRGILALGVFVHHSVTSYIWATTGVWAWGPNTVLNQLGQTTVALFFMTTGFLFTRIAMKPIKWGSFYMGRLARLSPLYILVVFAVFIIVLIITGEFNESPASIAKELALWLTFVCFGRPDVNGYKDTWILIAGVNWSLMYEVVFYVLAIPVLYWMNRFFAARTALIFSIILLIVTIIAYRAGDRAFGDLLFISHFLGGICVAYVYSIPMLRTKIESPVGRWLGAAAACSLFS